MISRLREHPVWVAAIAAVVLRLPGLTRPLRADEAGFLLVARSWHPEPDSLYGRYFVDRPPLLLAVVRFSDLLGPLGLRVIGALCCGVLVVLAARVARQVAEAIAPDRAAEAVRWTAYATAALSATALIDLVAVKGEVLALPLVMGAISLALTARRHESLLAAAAAGLAGMLALGLKQNLYGGLVVTAVLLAPRLRPALAAAAGAVVPVIAMAAWAQAAGVHQATLWYAVVGFRSDAARVVADGTVEAPLGRAALLVVVAAASGLLVVLTMGALRWRDLWAADRGLTVAVGALIAADVVGLALGASFWRDYLFPLVPDAGLVVAMVIVSRRGSAMPRIVLGCLASCLVALAGWTALQVSGAQEYDEADTGRAIADVARPGDTLVVFGGRADLQYAADLPSPYRFLWSLPMRTLDPHYDELQTLLAGPDAPQWFVAWVPFDAWGNPSGTTLERVVDQHYRLVALGCRERPIYLRRDVEREQPVAHCSS